MKDSIVAKKSKAFALRIINLFKYLNIEKKEFVLSKQILRSGTSIGANIAEANCAQSDADFIAKTHISLKECCETLYWLELLHDANYIDDSMFNSINSDCSELYKILSSIIISMKEKQTPNKGTLNS
ncbi:MAG: four helix bundle protein [Bacteroidales bacterium]|nr:four helix bundle protein [Bacteroidales bacterium]